LLAAKAYDVVVIARNMDRLMALQSELQTRYAVGVRPLASDLSDESAAEKICAFLDAGNVSIDLLINNAGYTMIGEFSAQPWPHHREFVQTMALTPIELTGRLLPGMLERGHGRIVKCRVGVRALHRFAPYGHVLPDKSRCFSSSPRAWTRKRGSQGHLHDERPRRDRE
jgi:short-subunit dehydrogenase